MNTAGLNQLTQGMAYFGMLCAVFFVFDVPSISDLLATFRFCYHCFTISKERTQLPFSGLDALGVWLLALLRRARSVWRLHF